MFLQERSKGATEFQQEKKESNLVVWVLAVPIASMILCTAGVVVRLFTRLKCANQSLYLEDWLLIGPAYICTMGAACAVIVATKYGLGLHIDQGVSTNDIVSLLKTLYAMNPPIIIALGAFRTSLLLFIQRLSKVSSRAIYIIIYGLLVFNIIHILVSIFVTMFRTMFRCTPISAVWTIDDDNTDHVCTAHAVSYVLIAIGLAIDVAIFVLPAILVIRINIPIKKKLQSMVMFALGGCGCIVESTRFSQVYKVGTSPDITYTLGILMISLFLQVVLGIMCCCAPAIKVFAAGLIESRCTKYLVSHSDDMPETIGHDAGNINARNPEDSIESGPESLFGEAANPREFTEWGHPNENIEMNVQRSDTRSKDNDKDRTIVMERSPDVKGAL